MKKIRVWMAVILAAVFCISAAAGCGEAELTYSAALETNTGYKADLYPYVVHGETADWYLAKADIEALGLEAMCEGLAQTMENMEADLADAREVLADYPRRYHRKQEPTTTAGAISSSSFTAGIWARSPCCTSMCIT